jgi:hypothetical protein
MKRTVFATILLSIAQFASARVLTPNMYTCKGHDVQVHYTSSSFSGKPTMSISGKLGQFSSMDVKSVRTPAGLMVSTSDNKVQDATHSVTLVIPSLNLGSDRSVTFKTIAIITHIGHFYPGQPVPTGMLQSQKYVGLVCKGQAVNF